MANTIQPVTGPIRRAKSRGAGPRSRWPSAGAGHVGRAGGGCGARVAAGMSDGRPWRRARRHLRADVSGATGRCTRHARWGRAWPSRPVPEGDRPASPLYGRGVVHHVVGPAPPAGAGPPPPWAQWTGRGSWTALRYRCVTAGPPRPPAPTATGRVRVVGDADIRPVVAVARPVAARGPPSPRRQVRRPHARPRPQHLVLGTSPNRHPRPAPGPRPPGRSAENHGFHTDAPCPVPVMAGSGRR